MDEMKNLILDETAEMREIQKNENLARKKETEDALEEINNETRNLLDKIEQESEQLKVR